jgi:hypothetical protein
MSRPEFDEQDKARLDTLRAEYDQMTGPRVGDYVEMLDGTLRRFTHDWGEDIQTTYKWLSEENIRTYGTACDSGSFYFGGSYISFSGSLDRALMKSTLEDTGKTREGAFWFFHHDWAQAHNGVYFSFPVRVYKQLQTGQVKEGAQ